MLGKADEDSDYYDKRNDRRWMAEELTENIVKKVCKYLEDKHIGTFDFSNTTCAYNRMIFPD